MKHSILARYYESVLCVRVGPVGLDARALVALSDIKMGIRLTRACACLALALLSRNLSLVAVRSSFDN
jgi:hypothetical protein